MDKFVEDAFKRAQMISIEEEGEYEAFRRQIVNSKGKILQFAAMMGGLDDIEKISEFTVKNGHALAFAEFVSTLLMCAFDLGYKSGKEARL